MCAKVPYQNARARKRWMPKVTCPPTTLTLRAGRQQHANARPEMRVCGRAMRPVHPWPGYIPDIAAKTPCKKPSSTSTTVADTSAATRSDWAHLDVALRRMSSAARYQGGRSRSESACRRREAWTADLARELEERRAASRSTASPSVVV